MACNKFLLGEREGCSRPVNSLPFLPLRRQEADTGKDGKAHERRSEALFVRDPALELVNGGWPQFLSLLHLLLVFLPTNGIWRKWCI